MQIDTRLKKNQNYIKKEKLLKQTKTELKQGKEIKNIEIKFLKNMEWNHHQDHRMMIFGKI